MKNITVSIHDDPKTIGLSFFTIEEHPVVHTFDIKIKNGFTPPQREFQSSVKSFINLIKETDNKVNIIDMRSKEFFGKDI